PILPETTITTYKLTRKDARDRFDHCFGDTNSMPYSGASAIILCFSVYGISAGGGSVIEAAGTLHALKNPSPPAGVSCTRMRTCSESIVNEWGMSRGANTTVPGVALIVRSPMEKVISPSIT